MTLCGKHFKDISVCLFPCFPLSADVNVFWLTVLKPTDCAFLVCCLYWLFVLNTSWLSCTVNVILLPNHTNSCSCDVPVLDLSRLLLLTGQRGWTCSEQNPFVMSALVNRLLSIPACSVVQFRCSRPFPIFTFYPYYPVLAMTRVTCLPWVCVCLPQVSVLSKGMDWSSWFLAWVVLSIYPTLFSGNSNVYKNKGTSLLNFI